jgi:hypothetical protein
MTSRTRRLLVAAAALGLAGAYGASEAGASTSNAALPHSMKALADTATGCLEKGTKSGEYTLTATDGKKYELASTSVPLSKHVGHTVKVEGNAGAMSAGQTAGDNGAAGGGMAGAQMMQVTKLTHLKTTCS